MFSQFLSNLMHAISAPFRRVVDSPLQLLSAPRRLWGLSLPARVAIGAFVVSAAFTIAIWLWWDRSETRTINWRYWFPVAVTVVLPLASYKVVRVWLESEDSRFPEVDDAWQAGIEALEAERLSLDEVPLYLVLGPYSAREATSLMHASGMDLPVKCVPQGNAPFHWFAGPDAAFIVCTATSQISRLSEAATKQGPGPARNPSPDHTMSPAFAAPRGSMSFPEPGSRTEIAGGTVVSGRGYETVSPESMAPFAQPAARFGTMVHAPFDPTATISKPAGPAGSGTPVQLSRDDAAEAVEWLEHLCRLIRKSRQPFCPVNGVLAVLPFSFLARGPAHARELQTAAQRDLDQIRDTLQLRCQVIALTGGMQREEGFLELMRRVGPEAAKTQRFGKGFNPWNHPTPEQMEAVAKNACGAFEDWTYHLFGQRGGHERIGNPKLYELLCKIRSQVAKPFADLLANGFGREPDPDEALPLLFGGCYFAATGDTEDHQAFVKNVFDKLLEQQDYVDWTEPALNENNWYQNLANLCYCLSLLALLVIVGIVALWFTQKK